ncbi:pyrimidine dimer DNA glycosylase/endonuclease V [Solemya velesiana gill symbiont]|uniref:DNA lyase n=1 Tax=Solemya velesiana gill symbiont TaxID=1918948 RepID=A0A1T2KUL1_9GAMM|nr:pyrimidine dimer DNA glycosylase/endonuclease V [Solemya velesiana gill symbiont]OOZ36553.1 DNA lyase [Solemya velesiana gill symbiont]
MRLWSIHPRNLDAKGLVALWRETLLAQNALLGRTRGYRNHPQLTRFKSHEDPATAIASYLWHVADEADRRGYNFDKNKIACERAEITIPVTSGQIDYELKHLLGKLKTRDPDRHKALNQVKRIKLHPCFRRIKGPVESWEVIPE